MNTDGSDLFVVNTVSVVRGADMTTGQTAHAERLRLLSREIGGSLCEDDHQALAAGAAALDEVATLRANEGEQLRSLSDALSGGNAATWDEVIDAAATLRARVQQLELALRAVFNSAVPHPEHHKAMTKAWAIARAALGTTLPVQL